MVLERDEKGKFFTDVIQKKAVLSDIQTLTHRMHGYVHVRQGERLSDEINSAEHFIAVTQVEIYNPEGEVIQSCAFMVINREHIVWIAPAAEENGDEK
jgi:hypothetical protein